MSFAKFAATCGMFVFSVSALAAPARAPAPKPAPATGPVTLQLSHQIDEIQAERLEQLVEGFNAKNKDVQVKMVRRAEGDIPKQLNLVTNEEYARFLNNKAKFTPLSQVMSAAKSPLDASKLSPELRSNLVDKRGQWIALPVAFSTPVLYVNKKLFRQAGLNPENPPKTWMEAQNTAGKLVEAGNQCAYTVSWPALVMIDNLSAWHGAEISDAKGQLNFNGLLQIKHVAMMATWYKAKYFSYFGRRDEADRRFMNGECGMLVSTSSLSA